MSQEILFIAHRIPFPPDRGDKIRSHHIVKALAALAPVHVACFADDDADLHEEAELAALAQSYRLVRRSKSLIVAGIQALTGPATVSLTAFYDEQLAEYINSVLANRPIGAIFVFSGQMAQYVPLDYKGRLVVDFVDVDSAKFEAYARKGNWPMRWIYAREAKMLSRYEGNVATRADVSTLVSQAEANIFRSRMIPEYRSTADIRALPNGIDTGLFDPSKVKADQRMLAVGEGRIIFTGQMDYAPNVAAVVRMAQRIMPIVHETMPKASFHIVGRNPTSAVQELHGTAGCHVWGRVDDIRPWLKAADMAVVPLEIARGIQNKVLEAMAMELPVVLSKAAATGIDAQDGVHFQIAEDDAGFAAAIINRFAMADPNQSMGSNARSFVQQHMSWESALLALPALLNIQRNAVASGG